MQDSKQLIQKVAQEIEASSRTSPTAAGPAEQTRAQPTDDHIDALNEVFTLFRINYHNQYYKAYSDTQVLKDRKSTRLNSSHVAISYAVFCLKKKKNNKKT